MILRPISGSQANLATDELASQIKNTFISGHGATHGFEPAWSAIVRTQNAKADRYVLIAQPDHAQLAGEMAAQFRAEFLPETAAVYWKEIAVHDDGWRQFGAERDAGAAPETTFGGYPLSFVEVPIEQAIEAWRGSIGAAETVSPMGAYMVSGHFSRLGRGRLEARADDEQRQKLLREFVTEEEGRQARLEPMLSAGQAEPRQYIDLLQLCDTLSLYVCCGATSAVELPQRFGSTRLRVTFEDGIYTTHPSLFRRARQPDIEPLRFHIAARYFPSNELTQLEIRIR